MLRNLKQAQRVACQKHGQAILGGKEAFRRDFTSHHPGQCMPMLLTGFLSYYIICPSCNAGLCKGLPPRWPIGAKSPLCLAF